MPNGSIIETLGFFAFADLPDSWYKVAALPAVLALFGSYLWVWGRTAELKHGAGPWKWWAVLPLFLAIVIGSATLSRLRDYLYKDAIEMMGPRIEIAHYVAFFLPLACIIALLLYEGLDRRAAMLAEER